MVEYIVVIYWYLHILLTIRRPGPRGNILSTRDDGWFLVSLSLTLLPMPFRFFFHIGTLLFKAHVTFTFFHPITSTSIALHCLFEILFQWTQLVIITSILEKYYGVSTLAVYWTSMIYMVIVTLMIVTLMIYMIIMTLVILLLSYICCSRNIEKLTIQKLNLVHGSSP